MLHLLILAAGLGRRFGGDKQRAPVGPGGAWILDYTIADALESGFESVVCVVRPEIEAAVRRHLEVRFGGRIRLALAEQTLERALPPGSSPPPDRLRPWGTAHAVLCAEPFIDGPFAVANADDLYGLGALVALADALRGGARGWALVAYPLGETLSPHGAVNRGLCRVGEGDVLQAVEEVEAIRADGSGRLSGSRKGYPVALRRDDWISMNLWGLDPTVFPILRAAFEAFVGGPAGLDRSAGLGGADPRVDELALPDVIGAAVARGEARVRVLREGREWIGMTHAADRDRVERALAERGEPAG
ncbi:MAG: NTP transferase domain-containing protein [Gemmatimonadetes bacterium]|nr:NTP transferase domain-containing protein [Gemmatimonadota bacterium]